ncbi:MAG TPA: long-chain fatty acid--CoA ligase [Falsiroseomonas sp.]|jgi:acyl-CoA synthetase (AMP-forming)/AMP-acid ligase II|nr:long-chain fatty acid--CoA ligase [Falsiroseomonas sp.]
MTGGSRLERLLHAMSERGDRRALLAEDRAHSYGDLLRRVQEAAAVLASHGILPGQVIGLQADFSPAAIALALALFRHGVVVAFVSPSNADPQAVLRGACADGLFTCSGDGATTFRQLQPAPEHPLLEGLRRQGRSGFVVFTTGTSGRPKAVLHDLDRFLASYDRPMKPLTTLAFLLLDHIAGLDTLFYTLHAGGALVLTADRKPRAVLDLIARWSVEVLPVSPSFLKLLCMSYPEDGPDLSSLRIITFGSEPMDPATLKRVEQIFPNVRLSQKYGASEFGAPTARTRDGEGLWISLESETVKVRVRDGVLWLNAPTTMLGYLNADAPATEDGWICTGDMVEQDGHWLRILGRKSDVINVGGEKVLPSEVEAVINELPEVAEVAVSGEPHPILGNIVTASIRMAAGCDEASLRTLVRRHCLSRLARFKVPVKIAATTHSLTNERQKTIRRVS